jgi:hypothetical protein
MTDHVIQKNVHEEVLLISNLDISRETSDTIKYN